MSLRAGMHRRVEVTVETGNLIGDVDDEGQQTVSGSVATERILVMRMNIGGSS